MADFLTTRGISNAIESIIKISDLKLTLVSPYLDLPTTLFDRLKYKSEKGVEIIFVYGKNRTLNSNTKSLLDDLNCSIYYKENLHAKCYLNSSLAVVCSMNLYAYSENHNTEMGVLLSSESDFNSFMDCRYEIDELISNSELISSKVTIVPKVEDAFLNHSIQLMTVLNSYFPNYDFKISDKIIVCENLPVNGIRFSNRYGFATLEFLDEDNSLDEEFKSLATNAREALDEYRVYVHNYQRRICIYEKKGIIKKEVIDQYRIEGIRQLFDLFN